VLSDCGAQGGDINMHVNNQLVWFMRDWPDVADIFFCLPLKLGHDCGG
jgi:hypothetical protein